MSLECCCTGFLGLMIIAYLKAKHEGKGAEAATYDQQQKEPEHRSHSGLVCFIFLKIQSGLLLVVAVLTSCLYARPCSVISRLIHHVTMLRTD